MSKAFDNPALEPRAFLDFQEFGRSSLDSSLRLYGEWAKGWQALATELGNFQQRSFEEGSEALGRLVEAKSIEQALAIQSTYAQRAYEGTLEQVSRLGTLYVDLARVGLEPGATGFVGLEDAIEKNAGRTSAPEHTVDAKGKARSTARGAHRRRAA